eukprot:266573_1
MSRNTSSNKRKREDISDHEIPDATVAKRAKKKPKYGVLSPCNLPEQPLPIFIPNCANIDIEKTLSELDHIPKHWDQHISYNKIQHCFAQHSPSEWKQKYLAKKFDIASNLPTQIASNLILHYKQKHHFIDQDDNICIITAWNNYQFGQQISNELSKTEHERNANNECILEIFCTETKSTCLNLKRFKIELEGHYIGIIRVPHARFSIRYDNSFDKFLIEHAFIFHGVCDERLYYEHLRTKMGTGCMTCVDDINPLGVIYSFKRFFDQFVCIPQQRGAPSNILSSCTRYSDLFDVYCGGNGRDVQEYFVSAFMILYELFDKPWIRKQQIADGIESALKHVRTVYNLENFEDNVSNTILQFVLPDMKPYDFRDFIQKQLGLEMDAKSKSEMQALNIHCGRYTQWYEYAYYEQNGHFLSNPLRYKYLGEDDLQQQKEKWLNATFPGFHRKPARVNRLFYVQSLKVKFEETCFGKNK